MIGTLLLKLRGLQVEFRDLPGQYYNLATPSEPLKTTEFLLSLSDSHMEKYADLMTTAVTDLLTYYKG